MRSPGRDVVAHQGKALGQAIQMAIKTASPAAAELVAGECVVLAETKDRMNWEMIGHVAAPAKARPSALRAGHVRRVAGGATPAAAFPRPPIQC